MLLFMCMCMCRKVGEGGTSWYLSCLFTLWHVDLHKVTGTRSNKINTKQEVCPYSQAVHFTFIKGKTVDILIRSLAIICNN